MPEFFHVLLLAAAAFAGFGLVRLLPRRFLQPARIVHEWEHGLLYVDGRFTRVLSPGRYRLAGLRERLIVTLPRLERIELLPTVDVTSADRLSYRLSGALAYTIVDPRTAQEGEFRERLRLAASDALIRLASERSLDAVLSDRARLGDAALALIAQPVCGCTVSEFTISAVTLPPELRRMHAEVERARLEGQAALERARGEQAALRSLANAARMLKGNPELMNLRLLQALSASGGKGATLVLGRDAFAPTSSAEMASPEAEA